MIIEVKCFLVNSQNEKMGIESDEEIFVSMAIDVREISTVRQRIHDGCDEPSVDSCCVYMKSGESFVVGCGYGYLLEKWKLVVRMD
jgi:hypothetical protein